MKQHFLVVTYKGQGQINPSIHLAKRIAGINGTLVTFSTAISVHREMFPDLPVPDREVDDGDIMYISYSDGFDRGFDTTTDNLSILLSQSKLSSEKSLSSVVQALIVRGRPVTGIIYTSHLSWVTDVAKRYGIPSALYWTQPATVFCIYYHYFHGYDTFISADREEDPLSVVRLPGLPPLQVRDLPSFLTSSVSNRLDSIVLQGFRETFKTLDNFEYSTWYHKPKVLVNTFSKLEADVLSAIDQVELIAVGPSLPSFFNRSLKKHDDEKGYMEWLDLKPEKSVVYVSFGSISVVKKQQMVEVLKGLRDCGRPYLWVVRKDCRWEGVELEVEVERGMVVEWCSQVRVLRHASVGCFVTHCGWNSMLESMACGVPIVGLPQWTDQGTNARLAAKTWGMGVRGELSEDGVVVGEELKRCLDLVMGEGEGEGEGERGVEIREKAWSWKEKVREATSEGGSSDQSLRLFVEEEMI